MPPKLLPFILAGLLVALVGMGWIYMKNRETDANLATATATQGLSAPSGNPEATASGASAAPTGAPTSNPNPDLSVDPNGLSKATVNLKTAHGIIKYKLYPQDAPNTVKRMIELIQKGFYNGLIFHRVVPGFVIQGGDPQGTGIGGSGQKLKAEFNSRRHVEGTVAMARARDPDSADSQFYITLGTHSHLDNSYTVFGQVIEGIDAARKIRPGDQMIAVWIE